MDRHSPATDPSRQWARVDSPIGGLILIADDSALVQVRFAGQELGDAASLGTGPSHSAITDLAAEQLDEYFRGARTAFTVPLALPAQDTFTARAQRQLCAIGYGETVSYAQLADAAGKRSASRTAGTACATNPLPIFVPCHRVTRADGSYGHYLGGAEAKRFLIEHERTHASAGTA